MNLSHVWEDLFHVTSKSVAGFFPKIACWLLKAEAGQVEIVEARSQGGHQ